MKALFLTPVITVFKENGKTLDWEANQRIHDYLIQNDVDGLVLMGSTGEFFSMSMETQKAFIDFAAKTLTGRTRIFIGTGRMQIDETIELSNYAASQGLSEVMIVSPYYFRLTPESLEDYYSRIASRTDAKIFLYNFPDRTRHDLTPELVLRLAMKHTNIVGIKDTVSSMSHTSSMLRTIKPHRPDFEIFSGYDDNLAHTALGGGDGCIGGLSNLIPDKCAAWAQVVRSGDMQEIAKWQKYINDAMALYDICTPFIPAVKYAMNLRGLHINEACSAPILPPTEAQKKALEEFMHKMEIQNI